MNPAWRVLCIVVGGAVLAAAYNTLSGRGIPWTPEVVEAPGARPRLILSDSMAQIQTVTLDAARAKYEAGVLFIDARPAGDFAAGHIRGAVNVPASKSAEEIGAQLKGLNRDDEVVVYCDGAECGSSTTVAGRLRELGFSRAAVFFGGWQEWTAARLPVAQGR